MGLIGAAGALGGLGINLAFRQSFRTAGSGTGAYLAFLGCYAVCSVLTWAVYLRRPARKPAAPTGIPATGTDARQLSHAEV